MIRRLVIAALLLSVACSASAAIVSLSDATLLSLNPTSSKGSTLDLQTDIAGDPGVQWDITFGVPSSGTWSDIYFAQNYPTAIAIGDTWQQTFKNVDTNYLSVTLYMKHGSSWTYKQGAGLNIAPGAEGTVELYLDPALYTDLKTIGIKVGTDSSWMGRPDGGSASVQIVPEPATLALLGLGSLVLRRKRK